MIKKRNRSIRSRLVLASAAVALAAGAACHGSVTDSLLTATEPDVINPANVNNADGATALRLGALGRLRSIAGGSESVWLFGGLLGDEWTTSSTFIQNDEADERNISLNNSSVTGQYRTVNQGRTYANQAIASMNTYLPTQSSNIGELYFARGFAELTLAQDFCNGTPLSDGSTLTLGQPVTNDAMFRIAMASFDTAIKLSGATDALTVSTSNAARVARARAQLGINDYAGAATTVSGIPTSFKYEVTFALTSGDNILWSQPFSSRRYNVGDNLVKTSAGNFPVAPSINFGSANDPRLPVVNSPSGTKSQDGLVISFTTSIWAQSTSIPVFNGIDARLIEAEAFLKAGDVTNYLATLNALRAAGNITLGVNNVPVMPALTDPGDAPSRVDLLFREKAFWTFSRGQRLSDMRRLIRQYGRDQATVFPTGTHYRGVPYGTDVNLPVPTDELTNPNFKGCLDRKA